MKREKKEEGERERERKIRLSAGGFHALFEASSRGPNNYLFASIHIVSSRGKWARLNLDWSATACILSAAGERACKQSSPFGSGPSTIRRITVSKTVV